jgi:hypothetical protein
MINDGEFYDTTPRPSMLRAMQAQKWTVSGALSELVDNSFGPGRGNASQTHIIHDTKARTIDILDNGVGMSAIGRLFQLGSSPVRAVGDIGNYGYGGSYALLWLGRRIEIWTLRSGQHNQVQHDTVDWPTVISGPAFPQLKNTWTPATIRNTPLQLLEQAHGTLIRIHLAPERKLLTNNVQRDLAATYAPGARLGKELLWTTNGKNGGTHSLGDVVPAFTDPTQTVNIDATLMLPNGDMLPVAGQVGVIDGLSYEKSSIAVGFGWRVIVRTKDCYVSPDRERSYTGSGVSGWLDLGEGWQSYLTTTKDGLNDTPAWDTLMGWVFERIEPLLKSIETTKLTLELDAIALGVQERLGNLVEIRVARQERETPVPRGGTGHPDGDGTPRKPSLNESDPGDEVAKQRRTTVITIVPQDEKQMGGLLAQPTEKGGGVEIAINQDHPVIQEALRQRPINAMMLNWGVTRELAQLIAGSESLAERVLTRAQKTRLVDESTEKTARTIHRWLMDSAAKSTR